MFLSYSSLLPSHFVYTTVSIGLTKTYINIVASGDGFTLHLWSRSSHASLLNNSKIFENLLICREEIHKHAEHRNHKDDLGKFTEPIIKVPSALYRRKRIYWTEYTEKHYAISFPFSWHPAQVLQCFFYSRLLQYPVYDPSWAASPSLYPQKWSVSKSSLSCHTCHFYTMGSTRAAASITFSLRGKSSFF